MEEMNSYVERQKFLSFQYYIITVIELEALWDILYHFILYQDFFFKIQLQDKVSLNQDLASYGVKKVNDK